MESQVLTYLVTRDIYRIASGQVKNHVLQMYTDVKQLFVNVVNNSPRIIVNACTYTKSEGNL